MVTKSVSCKYNSEFIYIYVPKNFYKMIENYFLLVIAKIRHLQDYQLRLSYNMMPSPSGLDIANCLKYFSQVLLSESKILYNFKIINN